MSKQDILEQIKQAGFEEELEKVSLLNKTMKSALRKMIDNAAVHKRLNALVEHGTTTALEHQSLARAQNVGHGILQRLSGKKSIYSHKNSVRFPELLIQKMVNKKSLNPDLKYRALSLSKKIEPGTRELGNEGYTKGLLESIKYAPVGKSNYQHTGWPYKEITERLNKGLQPIGL